MFLRNNFIQVFLFNKITVFYSMRHFEPNCYLFYKTTIVLQNSKQYLNKQIWYLFDYVRTLAPGSLHDPGKRNNVSKYSMCH